MPEREREISGWVDLSAATTGWSRRPWHRARVDGPWGRRKRWHHWCVTSSREVIAVTLADLDVVGIAAVSVYDRASRKMVRDVAARPLGWDVAWPEVADRGHVAAGGIELHDRGDHVRIVARTRRIALDVDVERGARESLGVATAWSPRRYAYSSKQAGLPARGVVDGRALAPDAVACLDWGRGVWPWRTAWNWSSFAGVVDGRAIAVNLGAQWTRGVTENAISIDGALTKIAAEVTFTPGYTWCIQGDGVDLRLAPELRDGARVPGLGRLQIAFGTVTGTIAGVAIPGLFGWAEELHVHW